MSIIDIVLGALLLLGLVRGFLKGLFVEIASLLALVLGIYGAIHFSHFVGDFLKSRVSWEEQIIQITAFAITFVIIVFAIGLAGKALTKLADFTALGLLNKILGAVFGLLKTGLILSILLSVIDKSPIELSFLSPKSLKKSILYIPVKAIAPTIFPILEKVDPKELLFQEEEK